MVAPTPHWVAHEAALSASAGALALRLLPVPPGELAKYGETKDANIRDIFLTVRYLGDGYGRRKTHDVL